MTEREVESALVDPYLTYADPGGNRNYVGLPWGPARQSGEGVMEILGSSSSLR